METTSRITIFLLFYLCISCIEELSVNAELQVVPLWKSNVTQNTSELCFLAGANSSETQNSATTLFSDDLSAMCGVHLMTSAGTGIMIQIPQQMPKNAFLYVEKQGDLSFCQNKFVVITTDEPCFSVFLQTNIHVFLQGNASIRLSNMRNSHSLTMCGVDAINELYKESEIAMPEKACPVKEFNQSISCYSYFDHFCSFEFPYHCNNTLGNRYAEFKCNEGNHDVLITYPPIDIIMLDISGQSIVEISTNVFINLNHLEKLFLNKNMLSKLHSRVFIGLTTLRELYLNDNKLRTLEDQTFRSLVELNILSLGDNSLTVLPHGLLKGLVNLEAVYLYGNRIISLDVGLFKETKKLKYLILNDNNLEVLPNKLFKGLVNFYLLYIQRNQIIALEGNLFHENKGIIYLILDDNSLTVLPNRLFKGLVNLRILHLHNNQIVSLDASLFNETRKLTELSLGNNNLTVLPNGLFKGLVNLETLYLYRNQIISLDGDSFVDNKKLIFLDLRENNLTVLSSDLLKELLNLQTLQLHRNFLISLHDDLFSENRKLISLNLCENNLTVLPRQLFKGLVNLETLHLYSNQILSLDSDLFKETKKLTLLTLFDNVLQNLPKQVFHGLYSLTELYLYRNKLTSLVSTLFQKLTNLKVLMMNNNMFKDLSIDLFWNLRDLKLLDLSHNEITNLNYKLLAGLNELQILLLRFNRLRTLDMYLFQDTTSLHVLELTGNQLTNLPNINNLNRLAFIGLRENRLTMIDTYTFANLPKQAQIVVSQEEICECFVQSNVSCNAVDLRSPYLTCDRLLSDRVLMAMMWLIGVNALGGNLFVLSRKKTKKEKNKVQTFLLANLAISDLFMGIYMLIIASADIYFGTYFPMKAETWRSGITCRIAGAISIISSEASVFFVTLISIDRFINIRLPHSRRKLKRRSSIVIVVLLWLTSFVLGIVPSILAGANDKFYDNSHVCIGLPLALIERFYKKVIKVRVSTGNAYYSKFIIESQSLGYVSGMYFGTAVFLGLNGICYFIILLCYAEIVRFVFKSSKRAGLNKDMKEQIRMTLKVAAIVLTDFFCWSPIVLLGIMVQMGALILPPSVFAWSVTVILPINSAINPYLYTIAAIISNRRKKMQISPSENQQDTNQQSNRQQTSHTRQTELQTLSVSEQVRGNCDQHGLPSTSDKAKSDV